MFDQMAMDQVLKGLNSFIIMRVSSKSIIIIEQDLLKISTTFHSIHPVHFVCAVAGTCGRFAYSLGNQ